MTFATRTAHLKPEGAYQVLARATQLEAAGREIIHLEIGQPDYATFENVGRAGIEAIRSGKTRYTLPAGMLSLREAIAEDSGNRRGIKIHPEEVIVSPGGKPNLFFPTLALVEPGDEVIYPNPGFPTYEAMIKVAGGVPVAVPLLEKNSFSFDLDAFDKLINERTKLIILNSPSNPTGGVIPPADLEHIASQAERYDCWVMSDEIYARRDEGRVVAANSSLGVGSRVGDGQYGQGRGLWHGATGRCRCGCMDRRTRGVPGCSQDDSGSTQPDAAQVDAYRKSYALYRKLYPMLKASFAKMGAMN